MYICTYVLYFIVDPFPSRSFPLSQPTSLDVPTHADLLAFSVRILNSRSGDSGGETQPPPPDDGERRQR